MNNIRIKGHIGTWYVLDRITYLDSTYYLLEHETYGNDAAWIITDESFNLILDDVWNGWDDLYEYMEGGDEE